VHVKNRSGKCEGPEGGGGVGVEARDFTVSEGHGHPLVKSTWNQRAQVKTQKTTLTNKK